MASQLKVTLVRSTIGRPENQKATVKTLGLGKINSSAVHNETPQIRGMINTVIHLIKVEEI
jgi:large subunit ribosomal protein L30